MNSNKVTTSLMVINIKLFMILKYLLRIFLMFKDRIVLDNI